MKFNYKEEKALILKMKQGLTEEMICQQLEIVENELKRLHLIKKLLKL
jgi:hypothetical protein